MDIKEFRNRLKNAAKILFKEDVCAKLTPKDHRFCLEYKTIKEWLENDININKKDPNGISLLHLAAANDLHDLVKLLVDAGANINSKTNSKQTALQLAAERGNDLIVKILLEADAKVNEIDKLGHTALFLATYNGHNKIAEMLLETGAIR